MADIALHRLANLSPFTSPFPFSHASPYNDEVKKKRQKGKKIHASKPTNPGWAKLLECNKGEASSFGFHATAARERAAIPLLLDWADYAQVSAAAKKADYLCPNRVVSLETQDAIISMGRVIIGDQANLTVRCWHWMRQSLTNEGFYMCEVNKGSPSQLRNVFFLFLIKTVFCCSLNVVCASL